METYLEDWQIKRYKRHVLTLTIEIAFWTLPRFSALNGDSPIIWNQIFQKLALWLDDLRLVAHIWETKRIDDFSQERICSLWNWVRKNLSLRSFVRRGTDERFFADADRVTMTKCSVNKKQNHDRYKKEDSNDEDVDTTRDVPTQLSWRKLYCYRNARRRHVVCRCKNRTGVFDHFRRHVSVSFVVSHTLPKDLRHWRRRYFVSRFSFDGWHLKYCFAYEKRMLSPVRKSKGFRQYLQWFSLSAISLHLFVRKRAQTIHLDVFVVLERILRHFFRESDRVFFLLHRFLRIPVREMIAKTLMCIMFFLSLYLSSSSL